jgi:hypothetical protein
LMCRNSLEPFFIPFGFYPLEDDALPPYFRPMKRLAKVLMLPVRLSGQNITLSVMRKE